MVYRMANGSSHKVTAVMPALNVARTLRKTYAAIPKDVVHEIILVDNASTDDTVAQARALPDLVVIVHPENRGYGGNQKTGYTEALARGADVVVMIHPDFQYDPEYVPQMIEPIVEGQADLVLGSRFLSADPRSGGMVWWRYWGNRLLTTLQNMALGIHLSEGHSGYRAYSRKLLETVPFERFSNDFVFDGQMIVAAVKHKFRIAEVAIPTRYEPDSSSVPFSASVRYGLEIIKTLLDRSYLKS